MSYSIKKAGVPFKLKLDTNKDLTGQAANFSAYYIDDISGAKTDITTAFAEDANTAGLYMVEVTIPAAGDYTLVINNAAIGMDNHAAPLVVVSATIEDVKAVVDSLTVTMNTVAADVVNLDGANLSDIEKKVLKINELVKNEKLATEVVVSGDETAILVAGAVIGNLTGSTGTFSGTVVSSLYDGTNTVVQLNKIDSVIGQGDLAVDDVLSDGTTDTTGTVVSIGALVNPIDSVTEFLKKLNDNIYSSTTGLSVLSGYTDDIENMLNGTEFLSDGTTANPFYDATNPGVAKESSIITPIEDLKAAIQTTIQTAQVAIQNDVAAVQTVVDANAATLTDAGYGLSALKSLIDTATSTDASNVTNTLAILNDSTNGLDKIKTNLTTRFDSVDSAVASLQDKANGLGKQQEFNLFA